MFSGAFGIRTIPGPHQLRINRMFSLFSKAAYKAHPVITMEIPHVYIEIKKP